MKRLVKKICRLVRKVEGFFPTRLPQGVAEFETWTDSIIDNYWLPTALRDDVRATLSTAIMHLGPTVAFKPKRYFVIIIRAGAAKQIAGAVFYDLKQKQKAAQAAEQANGESK